MQKLVAVILTAILMAAGMAAATTTSASAKHKDGHPYPGEVRTTCAAYAIGKPTAGKLTKVRARVNAPGSTYNPKGWVDVSVRKFNGGDGDSGRFFTRGGAVQFRFGPLKPGNYTGSMTYSPPSANSIFQSCSDGFFFSVRRAR